ncbi:MAG: hypothetical protein GY874_19890 [Desulfobacteraceae bacterium]|nr:hypothetical protein [Desulfobacteraceae bacterium]
MKRLIALAFLALFCVCCCVSCSQKISKSEYWEHETVYKNWDHMKFSWYGYINVTDQDVKKSNEQNWWGIYIPQSPAE